VGRRDRAVELTVRELELERVAVDDHFGHRAAIELAQQIGKWHRLHGRSAPHPKQHHRSEGNQEQCTDGPDEQGAARKLASKHEVLPCPATLPDSVWAMSCKREFRGGTRNRAHILTESKRNVNAARSAV